VAGAPASARSLRGLPQEVTRALGPRHHDPQQHCRPQSRPPPEQKNGVTAPEGKFELLLIGVEGEKSQLGRFLFLVHV